MDLEVAQLRAFNRTYTKRLGFLNPRLDDTPFTLSEARTLYEIATGDALTASDITRTLDLDPAQVSRTLKRFMDRGLITTSSDGGTGRRRPITLTDAGHATFAALERNTRSAVGELLASLPTAKRDALVASANTMRRVFEPAMTKDVTFRGLRAGDVGWITYRQAVLYAQDPGWNQEYEALVARILADFVSTFDPAREMAWVAEVDGATVGSIFLMKGDAPSAAKLRLLYVEPEARGLGVGERLVGQCIDQARALGYETLTLWTTNAQLAARKLYVRAGFELFEAAPARLFGQDLEGETWRLDLSTQVPDRV